jgi:hypothetical protein
MSWCCLNLAAVCLLVFSGLCVAGSGESTSRPWYLTGSWAEDAEHVAMIAHVEARAAAMDEKQIREQVDRLLEEDASGEVYWTLVVLGDRATPSLIAALDDSRFHETSVVVGDLREAASLDRLCAHIDRLRPSGAVAPLHRLIRDGERAVRVEAATTLGSLGYVDGVDGLRIALGSDDHHLRSMTINGIGWALQEGRANDQFRAMLFDDVAAVVDRPSSGGTDAPRLLLGLDRNKAIPLLIARMRAEHVNASSVANALAHAEVEMEGVTILTFLESLEQQPRLNNTAYGYGLQLLAWSRHPSAEARIEKWLTDEDGYRRSLAAKALLVLHGIPDAYAVAIDAWGGPGDLGRLPVPIRHYATAHVLMNEVNNGGFGQYFFNSYSDDYVAAVAALEAIGAPTAAALTRDAGALFGDDGPARDRTARWEQLASVDSARLDELSERFYLDKDHLEVKLARFALAHKEHFKKP